MIFRRRIAPEDPGPVVFDRQGRPVGVRLLGARAAASETRAARQARRLESLRKTRELDAQYRLRCSFSLFCSDPPA